MNDQDADDLIRVLMDLVKEVKRVGDRIEFFNVNGLAIVDGVEPRDN